MGNEIPAIFICLKTQCAFRRQPLFWEPTTVRVTSDYALSSPKEKEKVWSQVSVHLSFCYQRRGKRSHIFQLALITSQRIEEKPHLHFLLSPSQGQNHSYYFFIKCHLWVSNSLSQSGSTNAFTFWHLFVGLLNASANHGRPLHDHVIGTSLVLLFSPSLTESNKAYSMANDLHWFSIVYQLVITFYRILLCGRRSQLSF